MKDIVAGEDNKVLKKDDTEEGENYVVNELKIYAHEKFQNYDIMEAIEVNFDGIPNDMKVEESWG